MTGKPATTWITLAKEFLKAREGVAPVELAFLLGFVALVAAIGFVLVGDSIADNLTSLSQRVEAASTDMPNPLGGDGSIVVASAGDTGGSGGDDGGESGGNNGNGGGNDNGGNGNGGGNGNN